MVNSMTGFAARRGQADGADFAWDLRSVNGKGFDLRLRIPDAIEGLEPALRAALGAAVQRGNVSLALKVNRAGATEALQLNLAALNTVLASLQVVEEAALAADVRLAPTSGAELLALRGVLETGSGEEDHTALVAALLDDLPLLIAEFQSMRAAEGAELHGVILAQVDSIEALTKSARIHAEARRGQMAQNLRDALARVLSNSEGADPSRVAQELAVLAVKTDVTEELDRLAAHVTAARALLQSSGQIGRKLDFLMQEFMREANTLCSKALSSDLTRVGLDLKVVIDQMREQVQNVE